MYKIAVDIGGTNIKVAVINDDLEMIDYKKIKTPDNFHIRIVDETYKLVEGFVNQYQLYQLMHKLLLIDEKLNSLL